MCVCVCVCVCAYICVCVHVCVCVCVCTIGSIYGSFTFIGLLAFVQHVTDVQNLLLSDEI